MVAQYLGGGGSIQGGFTVYIYLDAVKQLDYDEWGLATPWQH